MNITVSARHLDLTDGMREHIQDKVSRLEGIVDPINEVHVSMDVVKKHIHAVEITLHTHRETVKGSAESEDMYVSIDQAVEKAAHHLERMRNKLKNHKDKGPKLGEKLLQATEEE